MRRPDLSSGSWKQNVKAGRPPEMGNPRCTAAGLDTLGEDGPAIWSSAGEDGPAIWSSAGEDGPAIWSSAEEDGPAIWSSAEEDGPAIWSSAADVGCRRAGRWTGRGPGVAGTAAEAAH